MEKEVPRPITGWERHKGGIVRAQNSRALIKFPDENTIQAQIGMQNEASRGIRLNHVRVCSIVSAEGVASRWSIRGLLRSNCARVALDVRGRAEAAVRLNRQHGHRTAKVVGYQHKLSRRMNAQIC